MPVNRQTVRELSRTTLYNITSSGQAWRAFLDAAARLYKYSFPEQVLIYAQEPEATACAAKEVWYTRMKRSLRPDAQAIALPDPHSHFGRLKYVFDVRETQPLPGAPEFRQWSLPFEALERVTDRLGQEYGISREPVVADRVYALVMNAPQDGVRLEDADFPLLMRKESMEAFAALLRADTRNARFLPPGPAGGQAAYTEAPRDLSLPFSGDRYLDLKDQYNRYALGCGSSAYFLFYDEDARIVSGALHTKVLHADVPPLGEVDVTGFPKEQFLTV